MYTIWFAMFIVSLYTAENMTHLELNFRLLILDKISTKGCLNEHEKLILCVRFTGCANFILLAHFDQENSPQKALIQMKPS